MNLICLGTTVNLSKVKGLLKARKGPLSQKDILLRDSKREPPLIELLFLRGTHVYTGSLPFDTAENRVTVDAKHPTRLHGLRKRDEANTF